MKKTFLLLAVLLSGCSTDPEFKGADLIEASRMNTSLGVDYLRKGMVNDALEKLERAVRQDPNSGPAHVALAFAYSESGHLDKSEKTYRRALKVDEDNPDIRNNFGTLLCRKGKRDEAEKYFLEAARHPRYKTPEAAFSNVGSCLLKSSPAKAETYLRQALEINPKFIDALTPMAWICYQQKDYWRAKAFLQRYAETGAPTAETLWLTAQTERALGNADAARDAERQLASKFPESEQATSLRQKPSGTSP